MTDQLILTSILNDITYGIVIGVILGLFSFLKTSAKKLN